MSEPPVSNCWEVDPNSFVPIIKRNPKTAPVSTSKPDNSAAWLVAFLVALTLLTGLGMALAIRQLTTQWNDYRETSARQELARIKSCIN